MFGTNLLNARKTWLNRKNLNFKAKLPESFSSLRCLARQTRKCSWCLEQWSLVNGPMPRQTSLEIGPWGKWSTRTEINDRKYSDSTKSETDFSRPLKKLMLFGKLNYLIVAFALVKIKHSKHVNTDFCKWAKLLTYGNGNKTSFNYLINLSTSIKFSSLFESFSSVERRTDVSKTFRDCFPFPFFDFTIVKPSLSIELLNKKSKDSS